MRDELIRAASRLSVRGLRAVALIVCRAPFRNDAARTAGNDQSGPPPTRSRRRDVQLALAYNRLDLDQCGFADSVKPFCRQKPRHMIALVLRSRLSDRSEVYCHKQVVAAIGSCVKYVRQFIA